MSKPPLPISKSTTTGPTISSKLKESPFIPRSRLADAKLPPVAADKMIDSQRAIKSPVRRASGSTKSNKEQKKSLRASLQKMVNPNSSGSTNRWKTKTTSKSNDKQTTVGSTTRELPSSSNRRTSQSKTAAATAICGAVVNKKMPRRPSVPAQRNAAPGSTAVPAIDSDAQTPKAPRRLTCSSTTTNTSSGRSISSFSADGSSMTSNSNDGCYPEDNGTVKDSDMRFSAGIPKHGVAAGLEADALNQHGQVKLDSAEMSYQLASAHAQLAAAKFNTAPSMKVAEDWQRKFECLIASADAVRGRILIETNIQRSIASVLKLSTASDTQMLNELHMRSTHVDSLCHELYLTLTHAYDWRIRYLQHLAGTLARAPPAPITPTDRPSNFDDVMTFTECEHGLTQKTSELRSFKANEAARSHEWKALIEVERLQSELSQLHAQVDQLKQRELDQQRHIQDLTRTFQLHEAEFELEIVTLRQAHDAHAKLTAAKVGLEEALKAAQVREIESLARHMEATEHLEQRYQALEAELKEREIRPLQEALDQTRRREMELVTQLQHQQQREADIISEIEEHVERIHTLETQVEQLQKQVTRNAEEKAFLEATAELIAEEKSASEEQLEQALAATSCVSLDDMVSQLQVFASAQEEFTRREAAMMLQQASVEAELGLLLKEYDRLTRSIHDSQLDRRHYESQILVLTQEKQALAKEVMDYRIKQGIGLDGQTTTLRKEFRQLMAAVKEEHDEAIKKEVEQRQTVANELRDLKHDLEMKCWDRVSTGVQTAFVAYPGVVQ